MMTELIFILCAITSIGCAVALLRSYYKDRSRILLWTALCFVGLALNNVLLTIDLLVLPNTDIGGPFWRNLLSAVSGAILLFGLIWELA